MSHPALTPAPAAAPDGRAGDVPEWELIELLFFAYRDFVGDPDRILAEFGFGRAHHRVLHFVCRRPNLAVTELLEILRITKQSLNRVLKELVGKGFVHQRAGIADRRQRLLAPTEAGRELALRLARLQSRRVWRALGDIPGGSEAASRFLLGMIDPACRGLVGAVPGARRADAANGVPSRPGARGSAG